MGVRVIPIGPGPVWDLEVIDVFPGGGNRRTGMAVILRRDVQAVPVDDRLLGDEILESDPDALAPANTEGWPQPTFVRVPELIGIPLEHFSPEAPNPGWSSVEKGYVLWDGPELDVKVRLGGVATARPH
jgi:hypothetical protein